MFRLPFYICYLYDIWVLEINKIFLKINKCSKSVTSAFSLATREFQKLIKEKAMEWFNKDLIETGKRFLPNWIYQSLFPTKFMLTPNQGLFLKSLHSLWCFLFLTFLLHMCELRQHYSVLSLHSRPCMLVVCCFLNSLNKNK